MKAKHVTSIPSSWSLLTATLGLAFAVTACQPEGGEKTVGQKVDEGIAKTEQATQKGLDKAGEKMESAASSVSLAMTDAAITTSINTALAKDAQLSALRIDVDTQDGKVNLSGKAPDETSKTRATTLAQGVEGVKSVENRLVVGN
jgi:osmotically-inducible protein OsmY